MSLVSQITALASRIATEIKAVRTEMSQLGGGAPDPHASTHASGGSDPVTLAQSQVTNLTTDLAAKANLSGATFSGNVTVNGTVSTPNEMVVSDLIGSGQLRLVDGSYGMIVRQDGSNTYFLLTAANDQYGGWNSLRPIAFSNTTGVVTLNNGSILNGAVYTNSAQSTSSGTARFRNVRLSTGNPSGGIDGDVWLKYS